MTKTIMGIEIGNYRIKISVCSKGLVEKFVVADLPDDLVQEGKIVSWEAMADIIKEIVKENNINCKNVAAVLPDGLTYIRRTTMPAMTIDQLKINLPFEFHDYITEERDKYVYDYSVIDFVEDETGKPKEMDLLTVAVPKETLEQYKTMFRRAGLKMVMAAPEIIGFRNLIYKYEDDNHIDDVTDYAILDIGHTGTRLHMFTGGEYEITRNMEIGGQAITNAVAELYSVDKHIAQVYKESNHENIWEKEECKAIYNQLAVEIMRVINFYMFNNPDTSLDKIYYCGGGSMITPLLGAIGATIEQEVVGLDELFVLNSDEDRKDILQGPASIGITWEDK